MDGDNNTAKWALTIGMAAGLVTVLAFLGIKNIDDIRHLFGPGPSPSTTTPADVPTFQFSAANPVQPVITSTDTTTDTTTGQLETTATAPGPDSWDSYLTDQTPFTAHALLPNSLTDNETATFSLVAAGPKPCAQAGSSDLVATVVAQGCTQIMTGVYLEYGDPNPPLLVSVEIFVFPNATAANGMAGYFQGPARWNLTIWCTGSGAGSGPCSAGPGQHGYRSEDNRADHRYLITAVAVRTDLSNSPAIGPWLTSASVQATISSGPENQ